MYSNDSYDIVNGEPSMLFLHGHRKKRKKERKQEAAYLATHRLHCFDVKSSHGTALDFSS